MPNETIPTVHEDVLSVEDHVLDHPYVGLKGRALAERVHQGGLECVPNLGGRQVRYLTAVCLRNGVEWPQGFFESNVDELMDRG